MQKRFRERGVSTRDAKVPPGMGGERLDRAIPALFPGVSRRSARALIERGSVYLDGRRCMVSSRGVASGSTVELADGPAQPGTVFDPAWLLWRAGDMLAVNKPGLVPFAPTRSSAEGCLLHLLADHLVVLMKSVHPISRLDTPTSGIALVALSRASAAALSGLLREGGITKRYLAWVTGAPGEDSGRWDFPLKKVADGYVRVSPDGSKASTIYKVIEKREGASLLELQPLTGRTHQIRVHCAEAGCPILGDRKYGSPHPAEPRALLHSWKLEFAPPGSGPVSYAFLFLMRHIIAVAQGAQPFARQVPDLAL